MLISIFQQIGPTTPKGQNIKSPKMASKILTTAQDVLQFWFGDHFEPNNLNYINARMSFWFGSSNAEFEIVQKENASLLEKLKQNQDLDDSWKGPKGVLAKLICFDQFSRCIYRGTSNAFSYDEFGVACGKEIVDNNWYFTEYSAIERLFIVMPFQHSENMEMQRICIDLGNAVANGAPTEIETYFKNLKGFPKEHADVIERFGRFPSRNAALVGILS